MTTARATQPSTMHPTQLAYATAKTNYDASHEVYRAECRERGATFVEGASSAEDDVVLELQEQIHTELEMTRIFDALRVAEEAMVTWSLEHAKAFSPAHAKLIDETHVRARGSAKYWPQVVDLAFRLAA